MTDPTDPADPTPPRADRTMSWLPIVGALVIAAVVAVVIFAVGAGDDNRTGSRIEDDGALSCPSSYPRSVDDGRRRVPTEPSGVDGAAALVPDTAPRYVAVCRYLPPAGSSKKRDIALDGRVVLDKGADAAATQLSKVSKSAGPRTCTQLAVADKPSYLLGFTFDTGVVWVSVPGDRCVPVSNGKFRSDTDLQTSVASAYSTKTWPR